MSGSGIMVLTLLLLVSMATSRQDRGVGRLMLRNRLHKRGSEVKERNNQDCTPGGCPDGQKCCAVSLNDPQMLCSNTCTIS
uniref:Ctr_27_N conopeptide n=1 Tax=Conus tribblei TaxID=101761 RepID=A0A0C9SEL6_CONTD